MPEKRDFLAGAKTRHSLAIVLLFKILGIQQLLDQFAGGLARHVLDGELRGAHVFPFAFDLSLNPVKVGRGVFFGEEFERAFFLAVVGVEPDPAEGDRAAVMSGEGGRNDGIRRDDAERGFGVPFHGVELVPGFCEMEIQFAVTIGEAERYGVRIIIVAGQGQDARRARTQHLGGFRLGQKLFLQSHLSEHVGSFWWGVSDINNCRLY